MRLASDEAWEVLSEPSSASARRTSRTPGHGRQPERSMEERGSVPKNPDMQMRFRTSARRSHAVARMTRGGMMQEIIGWGSAFVLLPTFGLQAYKQWQSRHEHAPAS